MSASDAPRAERAPFDSAAARSLTGEIRRLASGIGRPVRLMEVCGTHTMAIFRAGIPALLPEGVQLLSGPGCPVCVTPMGYMDAALHLAQRPGVTVATFGDMLKVPGSETSLEKVRAAGADVRVVYSPIDALRLAEQARDRQVVFLGVGFETTTPATALTLHEAKARGLGNFSVLSAHKIVPPALAALLADARAALDGLILPGHVSVILGSHPYEFIARDYHRAAVITGFEAADILQAIVMLLRQVAARQPKVEIEYAHVVKAEGNRAAQQAIADHFETVDAEWRGLGSLPRSGLQIRPAFADYDAAARFNLQVAEGREPKGCHCGEVLRGLIQPLDCPLFARACTHLHPVGACMVSSEGACSAYYKYHRTRET